MRTMATPPPQGVDFTTASPQTGSKLLSLPPEVKNDIYEIVLQDLTVTLEVPDDNGDTALGKGPGILLACKEVYQETWKLYYSTVTIIVPLDGPRHADDADDETGRRRLDKFLRTIGRDKSALLTSMIETPNMQPSINFHRRAYLDDHAASFSTTILQKVHLIEHTKRALGRSLLMCWYSSANGKPEYSRDPVQSFLDWSEAKERNTRIKKQVELLVQMARIGFEYQLMHREVDNVLLQTRQHKPPVDTEAYLYWSNGGGRRRDVPLRSKSP
ncbi:unnamed protein product [Zymoseptoria tritici ST99CH_3D1]|nr:unnamed protein product [Zymoseptoria tritici ST99CH_3D1]